MHFEVGNVVTSTGEIRIEGGKAAATPIKMVGVAYIIKTPWAGQGFVENLRPKVTAEKAHRPTLVFINGVGLDLSL